jgi:hypothetical protein
VNDAFCFYAFVVNCVVPIVIRAITTLTNE